MPKPGVQSFPLRLGTEEYVALKTFASVTGRSANDVVRSALREYLAGPGRRAEFESVLQQSREQYRVALDKLADL